MVNTSLTIIKLEGWKWNQSENSYHNILPLKKKKSNTNATIFVYQ